MISKVIFNKGNREGFTLIEVLLSIMLVSYVVVLVFQAFFKSLGAIDETQDRLNILYHIHNRLLAVRLAIENGQTVTAGDLGGSISIDNKPFYYRIGVKDTDGTGSLYKIDGLFYWFEGNRRINIARQLLCMGRSDDDGA